MGYNSDTVATIVRRLNVNYFLPAIQREFVWDQEQVVRLFDSLMTGYPIQSFLFWAVLAENRHNWDMYKFVENFSQRAPHNERASAHGVNDLVLVLDGQQRLTALLIGLKGTYEIKKKWRRRGTPEAWSKQTLYFDLLKDPASEGDDSEARYRLKFEERFPASSPGERWFRVGRILDCDSLAAFEKLCDDEEDELGDAATRAQMRTLRNNLNALYRAIWRENAISYAMESSQELDRVLDIFVRVNEGGTKLSKSDLLLSTITAHWEGINARDAINEFVRHLNFELPLRNDLDKDFVLKASLFLTDLSIKYNVDSFSRANIQTIQSRWLDIKKAIENGVLLVNSLGIDRDTLTSANALIPVIDYLFHHSNVILRGSSQFDAQNRRMVQQWLVHALLASVFGRSTDTVLTAARTVLRSQANSTDFPLEALSASTFRQGPQEIALVDAVLETVYGKPTTFLALSLLYDDNNWGATRPHLDHIFPQEELKQQNLLVAGVPPIRFPAYEAAINRIGNLELLLDRENTEKSDQQFVTWIKSRDSGFRQRHLIPENNALLTIDRFPEFVEEREKLIRNHISSRFGP